MIGVEVEDKKQDFLDRVRKFHEMREELSLDIWCDYCGAIWIEDGEFKMDCDDENPSLEDIRVDV